MRYALILAALATVVPAATALSDDSQMVQAIRSAPDPSSAAAAYARGLTASDALAIQKAYVIRLSELGRPDMAMEQASAALRSDGTFGLGWAVLAYNLTAQGRAVEAFADIVAAARLSPDDYFVTRTAGQLSALHESGVVRRSGIPASVRDGMAALRLKYSDNPAFAEAYRQARSTYAERFGTLPTEPPAEERQVIVVNPPSDTGTNGDYPQYPQYPQDYYPVGAGGYGGGGYGGGGGGDCNGCFDDNDRFKFRRYNFRLPQFDPSDNFVTNTVPLTQQELARQSTRFNNNYLYFDQDDFTTVNGQLVLRNGDNLANHLFQLTDSSIRLRYDDFQLSGNSIQLRPVVAQQSGLINGALDTSFRSGQTFIPVERRPGYNLSRGITGPNSLVSASRITMPGGWSTINGNGSIRNYAADVPTVINSNGFISLATSPAGTIVIDRNGQLQVIPIQQLVNPNNNGLVQPGTIWVTRATRGQTVNNDDQTLLTVNGVPAVDTVSGNRVIRVGGDDNGFFSGAPVVVPDNDDDADASALAADGRTVSLQGTTGGNRRMGDRSIGNRRLGTGTVRTREFGPAVSGNRRFGPAVSGSRSFGPRVSGNRTFGPAVSGNRTVGPAVSGNRAFGPATSGGTGRPAAARGGGGRGGGRGGGHR